MIAADVGVCMVQTDTSVQLQALVDGKSVHHVSTDAGRFEVGDNKTPATSAVALIFRIQTCAQLMALAQIQRQSQIGRQRILHKTAFQRVVGLGHITMTHGLAQFLAMVVLPGKVSLQTQSVTLIRSVAEHFQVIYPLVG